VRQLAIQYPKSSFNNGPLLIYLTARDKGRGEVAVKELFADSQLEQAKALSKDGGQTDIKYAELDIDSVDSIHKLANFLHSKHPDGIDFVINNAGIAMNGFGTCILSFAEE
jgi:carbonyl reductase 1